ncbi:MAG: SdrD B-like domain-containing protein [Planctomycetota bacterium]
MRFWKRADRVKRVRVAESLEPRVLMAADPIRVGVVYLETDYLESDNDVGGDSRGDRFILSFVGGAPATELTEIRIRTDKDGDGLSVGDPMFDTAPGGRGKNGSHSFQVVETFSQFGETIEVQAEVDDGGQDLILRLKNFYAGDRLEFTLDVDEILRNAVDLEVFNDRLDVITSGQEFQDSILDATFEAPHYETAQADALFVNDFGDPGSLLGLDLPPDEGPSEDSRPNRSAAALGTTLQVAKPIEISGTVWVDNNLDRIHQADEAILPGVTIDLWRDGGNGQFIATGLSATTDSTGRYRFDTSLGLPPGVYRLVQQQPTGYFSVAAIPGTINAAAGSSRFDDVGVATSADVISAINIPLGDLRAIDYDFAEAQPAGLSGSVYSDTNQNTLRDSNEIGIAGVQIRLVPVQTLVPTTEQFTSTDADGRYRFDNLVPGTYEVIEVNQPTGYLDGDDAAGTVDGQTIGQAINPGDRITGVTLAGGQTGIEYNFGEWPPGTLEGHVYLAAPGSDCDGHFGAESTPIPGVQIFLEADDGSMVLETRTDSLGHYRFENLPPGQYTLRQRNPPGTIEGSAHPGLLADVVVGVATGPSQISDIVLPAAAAATQYDFCEAMPASVSGYVFADRPGSANGSGDAGASDLGNGRRDAGEDGISGVTLRIADLDGNIVGQTTTDANGFYHFDLLAPGTYILAETQPDGWYDGPESVGTIFGEVRGAITANDRIRVELKQGESGVEYNFAEWQPGSLSGRVHGDLDGDCIWDPDEPLLANVTMVLRDETGSVVATTTTDDAGEYRFANLRPGTYTITQVQPDAWFEGSSTPGSLGGRSESGNLISEITVGPGQDGIRYDFCEDPPAEISGMVIDDRDGDCVLDPDETGIADVRIRLYDSNDQLVAETRTDANGRYRFGELPAGTYTIVEDQPEGYFHGGQRAGSGGGDDSVADRISQIVIGFGATLVDYNFCEILPAAIAGQVHVDLDGDCVRDPDEAPLAGVVVILRDLDSGEELTRTVTDADGRYSFDGLRPGNYEIVEVQPPGYFQGGQVAGDASSAWVIDQDRLGVRLAAATDVVDLNFCEVPPTGISGSVWSDIDLDGVFDAGELPLSGVVIELLDSQDDVVGETTTDDAGDYRFTGLMPGVYSLRQSQPVDYFHGGQIAGDRGGNASVEDLISEINLRPALPAIGYDFPEVPPAILSGYVFQDGDAIVFDGDIPPEDLRDYRDGRRTNDDLPLAGVSVQLRNVLGRPVAASRALPGYYDGPTIEVFTDASGRYVFTGLRPGSYSVYQSQPDGVIDGLDTAGSTGGFAANPADALTDEQAIVIQTLSASDDTDPGTDAILNVLLVPGGQSVENNFSEIVVTAPPPPPPPPPPEDPPIDQIDALRETPESIGPVAPRTFIRQPPLMTFANFEASPFVPQYIDEWDVSWHLSVINGGQLPGEDGSPVQQEYESNATSIGFRSGPSKLQGSDRNPRTTWSAQHNTGSWRLHTIQGEAIEIAKSMRLGDATAEAMSGDFDGDGVDEAVIFVGGNWYVDFNGDGIWDDGDLWIRLGTPLDRPVVGDWDGDGKDDVGIFGRRWERDLARIRRDPGLPDPANHRRRKVDARDTRPARESIRHDYERLLQRGVDGGLRADAVDHVFQYGVHADTPLAGDWNGDGIDQIGVFRAGNWLLDTDGDGRLSPKDAKSSFGRPGDKPIVGDFDGDGIDEIGVVRGNVWIIDSDGDRRITGNDRRIELPETIGDGGAAGDGAQPVVGDFDGDGDDDIGYFKAG